MTRWNTKVRNLAYQKIQCCGIQKTYSYFHIIWHNQVYHQRLLCPSTSIWINGIKKTHTPDQRTRTYSYKFSMGSATIKCHHTIHIVHITRQPTLRWTRKPSAQLWFLCNYFYLLSQNYWCQESKHFSLFEQGFPFWSY